MFCLVKKDFSCISAFNKMFSFKECISFCVVVAVVSANHYGSYPPHHHKGVNLHKLCSWNVVKYQKANELSRDDSWGEKRC